MFRKKSERYSEIAKELATIFHQASVSVEEKVALFYFPHQKQTEYNCEIAAGGCLYNHARYVRKQLILRKIISGKEIETEGKRNLNFYQNHRFTFV